MSSDENSSSKRTRASGEVLDYLLQEFENNHNPSPEQRKEISDKTNMTEKAVRIWFQNRRAKLRKFERMGKTASNSIHSSRSNSLSMNEYQTSPNTLYISNFQSMPIEVNEKYCFIDCSSLSVGSWQRIKTGYHDENLLKNNLFNLSPFTLNTVMPNVDLLVIISKKNFEVNYFFSAISNNSKILFRVFYPISSIMTCSLLDNNINKENNELRLSLSHQPKFSVYFFNGVNSNANQWSICDDFSEGQQVSSAYYSEGGTSIPHVLVGVKKSLQFLNSFILENNQIQSSNYNAHIQLSDPSHDGNFRFTDDLNVWNDTKSTNDTPLPPSKVLNGLSPLGQLDSDISPNSMNSNNSQPNPNNIISNNDHSNSNNDPYNEMFNVNTPDFFTSGQTPNSTILNNTINSNNENLINSPSTNLQSYTHTTHSPFTHPPLDLENNSSNDPSSTFDFGIGHPDFTSNTSIENSNNPSTSSSNNNNQVDSFIDYNSHYP